MENMENNDYKTFFGNYRALVTLSKDPDKFGRVKLWIPDLMPTISYEDHTLHLWARPANNPTGGRNNISDDNHYYTGSSYIPKTGSWVWCFFENGNPNRPYYWGALDIENSPVLAENQYGSEYENKWTVFKSHDGRCLVFSDDPEDARVEITGKKRQIDIPPSGDIVSVFTIEENQTTVLLDEREGKEKVLIKTYKGDYLNFDIETRKLHIYTNNDIHVQTDKNLYMSAADNVHISAGKNMYLKANGDINALAGGMVQVDGADTFIQSRKTVQATYAAPIGLRDQKLDDLSLTTNLTSNLKNMTMSIASSVDASLNETNKNLDTLQRHTDAVNECITQTIAEFEQESQDITELLEIQNDVASFESNMKSKANDFKTNQSSVKQKLTDVTSSAENLNPVVDQGNNAIDKIKKDVGNMNNNMPDLGSMKNTTLDISSQITSTKKEMISMAQSVFSDLDITGLDSDLEKQETLLLDIVGHHSEWADIFSQFKLTFDNPIPGTPEFSTINEDFEKGKKDIETKLSQVKTTAV